MDQMAELFVPIFAIIFLFGFPVAAFIVHRVLGHQERLEMIRRGIVPPPSPRDMRKYARYGAKYGWPPAGTQAPAGTQPPAQDPNAYYAYDVLSAQSQLRKGIVVACVGLALLIGLSFIDIGQPGPWLLGGLIPLFVGLAQIVIALMSGARISPAQFPYSAPPPNDAQSAHQAPRDVTPGAYAYRPGSATELEPPSGPPDIPR